jgi:hypothetical protein
MNGAVRRWPGRRGRILCIVGSADREHPDAARVRRRPGTGRLAAARVGMGAFGAWAALQGLVRFAVPSDPCLDRACELADAPYAWSGFSALIVASVMSLWVLVEVRRQRALTFVVPPGWPAPSPDWRPARGWAPDPRWPPAPDGWVFWRPR